jgi:hypothetical protein
MSFFSAFDKTSGSRRQAKFANMKARYQHMANRAKYNNAKAAFKANEQSRVIGDSRAQGDAYRKLIIGASEKHRKGAEQAYKAYAKARRGQEGGRSSKRAFSDFSMLLQKQAALENSVAMAGGEGMQQQMLAIDRASGQKYAKNLSKLGVPAQTPLMMPYQKENKFMTALNFANFAIKTGTGIGKAYEGLDKLGEKWQLWT